MGPNTPDNAGTNLSGAVQSEPVVPLVPDPTVGSVTEVVPSVVDAAKEAAIGAIREPSTSSLDQFARFGNGTTPFATDIPAPTTPVPGDVSIGANVAGIGTVADLLSTEAKQSSDASPTPSSTIEEVKMPKTTEELMEGLTKAEETIKYIKKHLEEEAKKVTV
jgi:hypothetical protein